MFHDAMRPSYSTKLFHFIIMFCNQRLCHCFYFCFIISLDKKGDLLPTYCIAKLQFFFCIVFLCVINALDLLLKLRN